MFGNYLTIAFRNLMRHKFFSFVNITGLAIGIASCSLILIYIQNELSYESFHTKGDRIYRVLRETRGEDGSLTFRPGISGPFAPTLMQDFPEVENAVRIADFPEAWTRYEGERPVNGHHRLVTVEPNFFTIFDFPFVQGSPQTVFNNLNSVVISEVTARKFFGSEDPIGKVITIEPEIDYGDHETVVSGVVKVPKNTILHFDIAAVATIFNQRKWRKDRWETWDANYHRRPFMAYVLLREDVDPKALEAKLPDFMERYMGWETRVRNTYHLQPLKRIHLYTRADYAGEFVQSSGIKYADVENVYLFSCVALVILIIACVNFMNLSTARSINRSKEVGLRKVMGAHRYQLVRQFLGEAVLLSLLASILALALVIMVWPTFKAFLGNDLAPQLHFIHFILVPSFIILIGFLAGGYPAFFLSAFEPVFVLKGLVRAGPKGTLIRKGLVVFQFALSILLIIGTGMIYRQLSYVQHKKLGFDKNLMVNMPLFSESRWSKGERAKRFESVKQAFLSNPNIVQATAYRFDLGSGYGGASREMRTESGKVIQILAQEADKDFMETFNFRLIAGRNFIDGDRFSQSQNGRIYNIIMNETAVKLLGWTDPIGKKIMQMRKNPNIYTVIGVVQDFHSQSLHKEIKPLFIQYRHTEILTLGLKLKGENLPETLAFIENTWKRFVPDRPFAFSFLDDSLNQLYREEIRNGELIGIFALLAILVASLGLFGLATFTAEHRMKEIGVRKVLGASLMRIILLLSKDFIRLVLIANVIAWPVAYVVVDNWLQNFAYHVDIAWWIFALSGIIAVLIALGTVSYQAIKIALTNPVDVLRHE